MKTNRTHWLTTSALLALAAFNLQPTTASAQGTAFTYQGRLNDDSGPANGSYDLRFALFDAVDTGAQQGNLLTNSAVAVSNGLFTVTLDFGNQFPGANRWLEIGVRSNGVAAFTTLAPRQPLTPAPYAVTAGSVISGGLAAGTYGSAVTLNNPANQISGAFAGDGTSVTNVNAATLGGIGSAGFWKTNGNIGSNPTNGAYIGTADNLPVEFKVNGQRALRLEYAYDSFFGSVAPNVIGGSAANVVSNRVFGAFIGGGTQNRVSGDYGSILGGIGNTASGYRSTAMGYSTTASGTNSKAMGDNTTASGEDSTAMGIFTTASGFASTAMGEFTFASGNLSTAMGFSAGALHQGTFVWGDSQNTAFVSTASDQFLIRAQGNVGINTTSPDSPLTVKTATSSAGIEQTDGKIRIATYVGGSTGGGWIGTLSNHKLSFYVNNGSPSMTVSTNGDVGIGTTAPTHPLQVFGAYCDGASWVNVSDRNLKQNFADLDATTVLEKVVALPVQSWSYKAQPGEQHIGPVAQDFHAAFGLGDNDRAISTVDENGVALAAIQGLNEKLETQLKTKDLEIQDLKTRLDRLEQLVSNSNAK